MQRSNVGYRVIGRRGMAAWRRDGDVFALQAASV